MMVGRVERVKCVCVCVYGWVRVLGCWERGYHTLLSLHCSAYAFYRSEMNDQPRAIGHFSCNNQFDTCSGSLSLVE